MVIRPYRSLVLLLTLALGLLAAPLPAHAQQPGKVYRVGLNLNAAKALGLTIPDSLLFQADRVIK